MKLYLTDGRHWTGTQADAKAAGDKFVPIEVPTDKPSLIPFLQKLQDKITELRGKREGVEIVSSTGESTPLVIPETIGDDAALAKAKEMGYPSVMAALLRFEEQDRAIFAKKVGEMGSDAASGLADMRKPAPSIEVIEDAIGEADPKTIIRLLSSVVSRFGEIAGTRGWAAFAKDTYAWTPGARNVEQGIGMMMLAAFNNFGWDKEA